MLPVIEMVYANNNLSNTQFRTVAVVIGASLLYGIGAGLRANYGILLNVISGQSGVPYEQVSLVLAIAQLVYGFLQPVSGIVARKRSNTFVLALGALLLASGIYTTSLCKSFFSLLICLGIWTGAGTGALAFGVIMGAVNPILGEEKAAFCSGIVSASSGLCGTVLSPVMQELAERGGLHMMMGAIAGWALLMVPVALLMGRLGRSGKALADETKDDTSLTEMFRAAFSEKSYWFLIGGFFTCGFHMAIVETHLFTQYKMIGATGRQAALAFSAYGASAIAGCVLTGALSSKFCMKNVLASVYASRVFVIALLLLMPGSVWTIFLTAILFGLSGPSTLPPTSSITGELFGNRNLATLFGIIFLSHQIGCFCSSWLGGIFLDATGGYTGVWIISIILSIAAAAMSYKIRMQ